MSKEEREAQREAANEIRKTLRLGCDNDPESLVKIDNTPDEVLLRFRDKLEQSKQNN